MSEFTDFKAGLQNVSDYLDAKHHISGTTAVGVDAFNVVASAQYSFSLRELICSVLGGHGFKLPNFQISVFANLNALLGLDKIQSAIKSALSGLADAFSSFMDNLNIDSILGRLNSIINEALNVANLLNFCGKAANPIAIPNMIERAFPSLLGRGDSIVRQIATPPNQLGTNSIKYDVNGNVVFNTEAYINDDGIFGEIARNYFKLSTGTLSNSEIDSFVFKINNITSELDELVKEENNISGAYDFGGSDFLSGDTTEGSGITFSDVESSTDLGVLHNPKSGNMSSNTRIASSLRSVYSQLGGYPVQYKDQTTGEIVEYNNIFELFVSPAVLELLRQYEDDESTVTTQIPVYDYCGNIIGYRTNVEQGNPNQSSNGVEPSSATNFVGDPNNYDPNDPETQLIYPSTNPQNIQPSSIIAESISKTSNSVEEETGFESDISDQSVSTSNSATYRRNFSGDVTFYQREIEYYEPTENIIINNRRRSRGNYIEKHLATVNQDTAITIDDHARRRKEYGGFELAIEHIDGVILFANTNIIWEGGNEPSFTTKNYHIIEFRNYGGNDWFETQTDNNYWLAKVVGSFPIPD